MGLGQKVDFYNGKMLCKGVLQETGNIGHFCWALLNIDLKDWEHLLKKHFLEQKVHFKSKKILAFIEEENKGVVPVDT